MKFICMRIKKIIFISMASHVASLWNRGLEQLGMTYSPLWGCVIDRVEMVVKVHCGTVLGDVFSTWRQIHMKAEEEMKLQEIDVLGWELLKLTQFCTVSILKIWLASRGAKLSEKRLKELIKRCDSVIRTILGSQSGREKRRDESFQA